MRKPWFRRSNCTWYVETRKGRQVKLGRDGRFDAAPKQAPKEPPPPILAKYHAIMQRHAEPEDRTLSFCIGVYMESLEGCTRTTIEGARHFLGLFLKHAGDVPVSKLKKHHLTEFLKGRDWTQNTVHDVLAKINACLNHCEREDWIVKNPFRGKVRLPGVVRREEIMSEADRERVLAAADRHVKPILLALAETGCRPIELRDARVEKCDLEKGVLLVPNKTRKKTGSQERPVYLSSRMVGLLRERIGGRSEGWLFLNSKGTKWTPTGLRHRLGRLARQLGITGVANLYSFRHAWASDALNRRKMNPALVALQLGHTDLRMLMKTYLHADAEAIRRELDA